MSRDHDTDAREKRSRWYRRGFEDGYAEREALAAWEVGEGYLQGYSDGTLMRWCWYLMGYR